MMTKHHDLVSIEGILVHETSKDSEDEGAFLIDDGKRKCWVPKQACQKTPHPNGKPNWFEFEMEQSLAEDKGFV